MDRIGSPEAAALRGEFMNIASAIADALQALRDEVAAVDLGLATAERGSATP